MTHRGLKPRDRVFYVINYWTGGTVVARQFLARAQKPWPRITLFHGHRRTTSTILLFFFSFFFPFFKKNLDKGLSSYVRVGGYSPVFPPTEHSSLRFLPAQLSHMDGFGRRSRAGLGDAVLYQIPRTANRTTRNLIAC